MHECTVTSGFLIEKTFTRICREFLATQERQGPDCVNKGGYSTPRTDIPADRMSRQYRGLQREPLQGWMEGLRGSGVVEPADSELNASLFLDVLMKAGKTDCDIILTMEDAKEVMRRIEPPVEREIVWARQLDAGDEPPAGTVLLGYEPSTFWPPTSGSAVAEGLFFTYPVPNDKEALRLREYHDKLNQWGLFDTPANAEEYLKTYLSLLPLDWDEHRYRYYTTEVRAIAD